MSRDYLPCPPQMRNGGLPPAHLSFSLEFTLLHPCHWLAPPQHAPERHAPDCVIYVATYALAQYNAIIDDRAINLLKVHLAHCAKHAEHVQQADTTQSTALAKWQCQEDATITNVLAKEVDMQSRHNDSLCTITDDFTIELDSRRIMVPSNGMDDVPAFA